MGSIRHPGDRDGKNPRVSSPKNPRPTPPRERKPKPCPDNSDPLDGCLPGDNGYED